MELKEPVAQMGPLSGLQQFAQALVRDGAVMVTATDHVVCRLVGHLVWYGDTQAFWFEAHAIEREHAHGFEYDDVSHVHETGLCFLLRGHPVAYLCSIDTAPTPDRAALRAESDAWKAASSGHALAICGWCAELYDGTQPRFCAWESPHCAGEWRGSEAAWETGSWESQRD